MGATTLSAESGSLVSEQIFGTEALQSRIRVRCFRETVDFQPLQRLLAQIWNRSTGNKVRDRMHWEIVTIFTNPANSRAVDSDFVRGRQPATFYAFSASKSPAAFRGPVLMSLLRMSTAAAAAAAAAAADAGSSGGGGG
jgi:hypothetical protein